ncbi:hypothetical protein [Chryseobacterium polytrichastri]|uniref:WG containing repeat-containing protein n=1 Tax=Chryseobacterium polytrichastri TaxID=1302687 RepID=A0A1M7E5B4_9FLAO|nr:hypothetical protein [Chryseobacterium polytrichastri]SHL86942.1 hypothetical protein SAMN05444267_10273 [Chryseobacterium polytrichastri]
MKILNVNFKYLWIFLVFISGNLFSQEQKYIPFRRGNLWGLCEANKFIAVQPQYYSISWYDESVGGFHAEQNGKFGIIDSNATIIMPFISDKPIIVNGENYLVFEGLDYYNYSIKTKMRLDKYIEPERYPINDRWGGGDNHIGELKEPKLTWDDLDDEDLDMIKPFEDEQNYQINFKANFVEILSKDSHIGIYIPKIKKMYLSTPDIAYVGWQFYNGKPYILSTNSTNLFGLVDENSNQVYPIKYASINLMDGSGLVVVSEPDQNNPNNLLYQTIFPNNKVLEGQFFPQGNVWRNGSIYRLYYKIVNGLKNYAGEDGTPYFEG